MMRAPFPALLALAVAACGPDYSPNTYSSSAVQQAAKVDQGTVVGVRKVDISASGIVGATAGAAAGGAVGAAATGGSGVTSALSAIGGGLVGGLVGTGIEHASGDTFAYEYIVRKENGELLSVTQKDATPLAFGQRVLLIAGGQARIVPDYTYKVVASPTGSAGAALPTEAAPVTIAIPKPQDPPAPADPAKPE